MELFELCRVTRILRNLLVLVRLNDLSRNWEYVVVRLDVRFVTCLTHLVCVRLSVSRSILITITILAYTLIQIVAVSCVLSRIFTCNVCCFRVAGQTAEGHPTLLLTEELTGTLVHYVVYVNL